MAADFVRLKTDLVLRKTLYNDPDFRADDSSLSADGRSISRAVRWLRPGEIVKDPQFMIKGAHRFDVMQGEIGDCWFISSIASLANSNLALLSRCVPPDQHFDKDYAGIFHFFFWQFDHWEEVIIDDRLPTRYGQLMYARNSQQKDEFWPALMEKAYAKFRGNYAYLEGGHLADAMCDLTGGIPETVHLKKQDEIPEDFFYIMVKTSRMHSMMGCSIDTNYIPEEELPNGLYKGHAYSITGFGTVTSHGLKHKLLRLRNPWGKGEWNGAWSDKSPEWRALSDEEKKRLEAQSRYEEGEFWMPYEEFLRNFDLMQFCHLTPDAFTEELEDNKEIQKWEMRTFNGEWIRGFSAGGCDTRTSLFFSNPQFQVTLTEPDDDEGLCTMIVSLTQKGIRSDDFLHIGYFIFRVRDNQPVLTNGSSYDHDDIIKIRSPDIFLNLRDRTGRHSLPQGRYVIIPSTYRSGTEGRFILKVLNVKAADVNVVDEPTRPIPAEDHVDVVEKLFNKHANGQLEIDANECTAAINEFRKMIYRSDKEFSTETCRSLMATRDKDKLGMVDKKEFKLMCKDLKYWRNAFKSFDFDKSGYIESSEMADVFKSIGFTTESKNESFSISRKVSAAIIKRYGGRERRFNFESFVHCCARLMVLYDTFKKFSNGGDVATLSIEDWLGTTMFL